MRNFLKKRLQFITAYAIMAVFKHHGSNKMEITTRPIKKSAVRIRSKDYPFASLAVGQAFFIPAGQVERKKFSVMMNSMGKRLSVNCQVVKFSWQSGEQNGVKGAFVQRIS